MSVAAKHQLLRNVFGISAAGISIAMMHVPPSPNWVIN